MGKKRMGKKIGRRAARRRARAGRGAALARLRGGGAQTVDRAARLEAVALTLSEANKAKLARRESAHATRAACRALRHRVRQWRATAGTARLARAAARKRRAAARRSMARGVRRAQGSRSPPAPGVGCADGALRDWRSRTAERRGMAELARLAAAGAFGANARVSRLTPGAARRPPPPGPRARRMRDSKKTERFRGKPNFVSARTFVTWADLTTERRETRLAVDFKIASASLLTLRRCVHAWFGVACRNAPETRARYGEIVAEARLRLALRAMAENRESTRGSGHGTSPCARRTCARSGAGRCASRRAAGARRGWRSRGRARAAARRRALARVAGTVDAEHSLAHQEAPVGRRFAVRRRDAVPDTDSRCVRRNRRSIARARTGESRTGASRTGASRRPARVEGREDREENGPFRTPRASAPGGFLAPGGGRGALSNATARVELVRRAHHAEARGHRAPGAVVARPRRRFR